MVPAGLTLSGVVAPAPLQWLVLGADSLLHLLSVITGDQTGVHAWDYECIPSVSAYSGHGTLWCCQVQGPFLAISAWMPVFVDIRSHSSRQESLRIIAQVAAWCRLVCMCS